MSKLFAVIVNGKVVNTIVAESIEDASIAGHVVEYQEHGAAIGWDYDGENFINPETPEHLEGGHVVE